MHAHPAGDGPSPHPTLKARLRLLLLATCDVYALSIIPYLVLRVLVGDDLWPVALMGVILHWLLLPAFVLLPVMLLTRRWLTAALTGLNVAVFLWLFGGLFLPNPAPRLECANPCPDTIRVLTYNIGSGLAGPDALAEMLRESEADVVILQEVMSRQAATLDARLADVFPYRAFYPGAIVGKGLLSRYPIIEEGGPVQFNTAHTYWRAVLDVDGTPVTIVNAHPPKPRLGRNEYTYPPGTDEDFIAVIDMAAGDGPTIIAGDFNTTDQSDNYARITAAGFVDAFREAGWGFGLTYMSTFPRRLFRIDFIFHTDHFRAASAWVGPHVGSDHLPVIADLVLEHQAK